MFALIICAYLESRFSDSVNMKYKHLYVFTAAWAIIREHLRGLRLRGKLIAFDVGGSGELGDGKDALVEEQKDESEEDEKR